MTGVKIKHTMELMKCDVLCHLSLEGKQMHTIIAVLFKKRYAFRLNRNCNSKCMTFFMEFDLM